MKPSDITVTDQFCGAGGSSAGATKSGLRLVMALNHWEKAIETHNANFPHAAHDCTDISACNPRRYPSTNVLLTSPECTNHTLAKGISKKKQIQPDLFGEITIDPAEERSRATMWDVPRFAEYHNYEIIIVENVVDASQWIMWPAWLQAMHLLGYEHKCLFLNSMFAHPTPQSRDRLYVIFWKKGNKAPDLEFTPSAWCAHCEKDVAALQTWKNGRTAGKYKKQYIYTCPTCRKEVQPYYHAAANAIDWSLPIERIGDRKKPLKPNTMERIRKGLQKCAAPLTVDLSYSHSQSDRSRPVSEVLTTLTTRQTTALAVPPFIVEMYGNSTTREIAQPLSTIVTNPHHGLVIPLIISNYSPGWSRPVTETLGTITTADHHSLLIPFLTSYYGTGGSTGIEQAMPTVTTKDRHALTIPDYQIEDCGFRMLQPHELQRAMAFPDDYILLGDSRTKVKLLGNAVTPPVMQMITERCMKTLL